MALITQIKVEFPSINMYHNSHHCLIKNLETEEHVTAMVSISELQLMAGGEHPLEMPPSARLKPPF